MTPHDGLADHLEVDRLSKRYGSQVALEEVTFDCAKGRFLVLLGPSGSGKTTLLRCLAGIERVTGGRVALGGRVVVDGRVHIPPERRDLAMVFQDFALWPHMTVLENVAYALRRRRNARDERRARSLAILDRVGLAELAGRYPSQLSGGQQQRVALARALVAQPSLLLFDEPLSNLDADLREKLRVEIATLVRESGPTVVYITHDQAEAFALADEVGILQNGRLVQLASPEEIYNRPATEFVARFTGVAGEMPVAVSGAGAGGRVKVLFQGAELEVRCAGSVAAGGGARLLIRPAAGSLCAPEDGGSHALRGRVRDVAFRGRGYEHVIDLAGGHRVHGLFAERKWDRGANVGVKLDAERCLLFPEEAGRGAVLPGELRRPGEETLMPLLAGEAAGAAASGISR